MSGRASAIWKLLTSLAILLGVGLQLTDTPGRGPDWSTFAYFTTLSNLLVLSWALPAALRLWRGREAGAADSVWRGMAVMGVAITFLVANCLLDGVRNQAGEIRFSLFLLHELTPLMTAADWLVFDPRGWMRRRDIPAWAAFPCGYTAVFEYGGTGNGADGVDAGGAAGGAGTAGIGTVCAGPQTGLPQNRKNR